MSDESQDSGMANAIREVTHALKSLTEQVKTFGTALFGTHIHPETGLVSRVYKLEESERRRSKFVGVAASCLIVLTVTAVWKMVTT